MPVVKELTVQMPFGTLSGRLHSARKEPHGSDAVVLWPSLFSTADVQHELIDLLSEDRVVLAIDPPGHGTSVINDARALTMRACSDAACEMMDIAGISNALWVGTSWGGLVGLDIAQSQPGKLKHLACLNTPFSNTRSFFDSRNWLSLLARFIGTSRIFSSVTAKSFYLPSTRSDPKKAKAMKAHHDTFRKGNAAQLAAAAALIFHKCEDVRPMLPNVKVPTLVIAGLNDPMYNLEDQRAAAEALPSGTLATVKAAHIAAVDAVIEVHTSLQAEWDIVSSKTGELTKEDI